MKLKSRHPILAEDNLKVKDLPDKKTHEISRMANLVADICDQTNTYNVIDIGRVSEQLSANNWTNFEHSNTLIRCWKRISINVFGSRIWIECRCY